MAEHGGPLCTDRRLAREGQQVVAGGVPSEIHQDVDPIGADFCPPAPRRSSPSFVLRQFSTSAWKRAVVASGTATSA